MQASASFVQKPLTEKQRYWLGRVKRCEAAGQSMVAYAREQSLDLKQFYNWKTRLTQLGVIAKPSQPATFNRVLVRSDRDSDTSCTIEFPSGTRLVVAPGCDPVWLSSLVKALVQFT